jgi:hypothetical protein
MLRDRSRNAGKHRGVWLAVLGLTIIGTNVLALDTQDKASREKLGEKTEVQPSVPARPTRIQHRFWDSTNAALFAGVGGARALDYASTQYFRQKGINERLLTNSVVDNKPLFGAIEGASVAASVAISYLFHRSGHHKLERWVSIVHVSVGVGGSIRNYMLKPSQTTHLPP